MPRTKASNQSQYKYNAAHLKRVPLDMQLSEYEELKQAATLSGESVNGYIKQAIRDRMNRTATQTASTVAADTVPTWDSRDDKFRWENGDVETMSSEEWEQNQKR